MNGRDDLTGVLDKSTFNGHLVEVVTEVRATGSALALLHVDIDNMKHFNLHNGPYLGDELLKRFVTIVKPLLGNRYMLYRPWGDEFTIILPDTTREEALRLAQKICDISRDELAPPQPTNCGDPRCLGPAKISVSIGVAMFEHNMNVESFLQSAEKKMYEAKSLGRDRVCM